MFDSGASQEILDAFVNGEYEKCATLGFAIKPLHTLPTAVQSVFISLQRLGRQDDLNSYSDEAKRYVKGIPYLNDQYTITLGEVDVEDVLARTEGPRERCQANYYAGSRLLTLGQFEGACARFREAAQIEKRCLERDLARVELALPGIDVDSLDKIEVDAIVQQGLIQISETCHDGHAQLACEQAEFTWISLLHRYGSQSKMYVSFLSLVGSIYYDVGRYRDAEATLRRSIELESDHLSLPPEASAITRSTLAQVLLSLQRPAEALALETEAAETFEGLRRSDPMAARTCSISHGNLASCHQTLGNMTEADRHYRKAFELINPVQEEFPVQYVRALQNWGVFYSRVGHTARALALLEHAREERVRLGVDDHPDLLGGLESLAGVYAEVRRPKEAIEIFKRVKAKYEEMGRTRDAGYARALIGMGLICLDQSIAVFPDELSSERLAAEHPELGDREYAEAIFGAAAVNMRALQAREAEACFGQAFEIHAAIHGERSLPCAEALSNLALLGLRWWPEDDGGPRRAEKLFRQTFAIEQDIVGSGHPTCAITLSNLSVALAKQNQNVEALAACVQACEIDANLIEKVFAFASDSHRAALLNVSRRHLFGLLSLVVNRMADQPDAVAAAYQAVIRHKAMGTEASIVQREATLTGRYPEAGPLLARLSEIRQHQAGLELEALSDPQSALSTRHRRQVLDNERESIEAKLARTVGQSGVPESTQRATTEAVADSLPSGVILVEYLRYDSYDFAAHARWGDPEWKPARYAAFVINPDAQPRVSLTDLGEADPIDTRIDELRSLIERSLIEPAASTRGLGSPPSSNEEIILNIGRSLRESVWDTVIPPDFKGDSVIVAPDGPLCLLPVTALPRAHGGHVIDDRLVTSILVGRDLLRTSDVVPRAQSPAVVVADPNFDFVGPNGTPPRSETPPAGLGELGITEKFDRLEQTAHEGDQIAAMLGVAALKWNAAVESAVKAVKAPRILHLATHGVFLKDPPGPATWMEQRQEIATDQPRSTSPLLRSWLLFAGANTALLGGQPGDEAEDGVLTAEEVTTMDLLGTELVVLSACQTGAGETQAGEGVMGLGKSFLQAGARAVVSSLWSVDDESTQRLMRCFYELLIHKGNPVAQALRQAQIEVRNMYPSLVHWAAFVCHGGAATVGVRPF